MVYRCGDYASGLEIQGVISEFKAVRTQRVNTNVAINPLNTELNSICHLLTVLGAHHIFHISALRVKTFQ